MNLAAGLGHADLVRPFQDYCVGLLSAEGRKSVEPLAALTAPERTARPHQSLLHFVAAAPWSDATMLREVRERVLPVVTRDEPAQALIFDDTSYPKKGKHSVGVTRLYCGERGKQDNYQSLLRRRRGLRSALRWRRTGPACQSPTSSTCRRTGRMMRSGVPRPECRRKSNSKPSRRSR